MLAQRQVRLDPAAYVPKYGHDVRVVFERAGHNLDALALRIRVACGAQPMGRELRNVA